MSKTLEAEHPERDNLLAFWSSGFWQSFAGWQAKFVRRSHRRRVGSARMSPPILARAPVLPLAANRDVDKITLRRARNSVHETEATGLGRKA
ncbi:MAG TPA: hypothetical protein VGJ20_02550 [Xanthobacteraceae bacterium]